MIFFKKTSPVLYIILLIFILTLAGCSGSKAVIDTGVNETTTPTQASKEATTPDENTEAALVKETIDIANPYALLGYETADELYQQALKEGGKVIVYSISSRMADVVEGFEAAYPGVKVEAYDIRQNELLEKVTLEHNAGIHNVDVMHIKDPDGTIYNEYVSSGKFICYYPMDICAHVKPSYLTKAMPLYMELDEWFYNTEIYPKEPPIDSWWDLTREEWNGKLMLKDPLNDIGYMAMLTSFVLYSDVLEEVYEEEFGEPITLSEGCTNAGEELLYRLTQNDLIFITSGSEVTEGVGTPGQTSAPLGMAASSKMRDTIKDGLAINVLEDIKPFINKPGMNYLYMMEGTEHPAAAKLLIRWLLGEADGKGIGFNPFNTQGGWSLRDDVPLAQGNTPLADLKMMDPDLDEVYNSILEVQDFWTLIQQ